MALVDYAVGGSSCGTALGLGTGDRVGPFPGSSLCVEK